MSEKKQLREEQCVFGIAQPEIPGDVPTVVLGVPIKAWDYMKDGHAHTFDLRAAGVPVKILLFGADTGEAALEAITAGARAGGIKVDNQIGNDFSIQLPKDN